MRGGTIVVRGNCGPRTAANMKGGTMIVEGSVGYLAGFMTHDGDLIVCGDAGEALGDSLWAGRIYVAGKIAGLGADAKIVETDDDDRARLHGLLRAEGIDGTFDFKRVMAEQKLWYFDQRDPEAWLEDMTDHAGYAEGRSPIWSAETIRDIHAKAELGRYQIRGFSAFRRFPTFDDLVFLPAVMTRLPLEGYREHCETRTVIGGERPDLVERPLELEIPVYLTSMSFGALGTNAKMALGRGFTAAGSATCTGEGGMLPEEREALAAADLPDDAVALRARSRAPAAGRRDRDRARPGREARHRRAAARHEGVREGRADAHPAGRRRPARVRAPPGLPRRRRPQVKIEELREATDYQVPIILKLAACRVEFDVKIAAKTGCDAIVLDGTEGATAAAPEYQLDNCGIPTLRRDPGRAPRDRGPRDGRQGQADRLGRRPQRRRRRQGPRARRRLRR